MAVRSEVVLTPADIPGAQLEEPFEAHTIPALRWWLQCRGYVVPTSCKKPELIARIRTAVVEGKASAVIDVDGSYLYAKHKRLIDAGEDVAPLQAPSPPPCGWLTVTEENAETISSRIPPVTAGLVYTYLAGHVGQHTNSEGAFRALKRGYAHWASGRLARIDVNMNNPEYCHVRATTKASMKPVSYNVGLLLKDNKPLTSIIEATCQCAAGNSASCTHVSALLHALAGLTPSSVTPLSLDSSDDDETAVPVTSQLCVWKVPKKRKEGTQPMSKAVFQKHDYMKPVKRKIASLQNFDPRPPEYRGTAATRLPSLLESISGQGLCISLLLDPKCKHWNSDDSSSKEPACNMPNLDSLRNTISAFKETLQLSEDKIRHIEQNTREQRRSPLWHAVRRYRITASNFGAVMSRRLDTPPGSLVLRLLQPREISTPAMQYGIEMEPTAIAEYVHQNTHGHPGLTVSSSGFLISASHPFLGASPDGVVYDPSNNQEPFGF